MTQAQEPSTADGATMQEAPLVRTFHSADGSELHFRYVGRHEGRHFVVNVRLPLAREGTSDRLNPEQYRSAITNVLDAVIAQVNDTGELGRSSNPLR